MGRDPRDPRLLLRVLRGAEREQGGPLHAFHNAEHIIRWQRWLGIYHEETLQDWAQHFKPLIIAGNYFYGSLHFVVTIAAGIFLFRKFSDDYPRYRNTLAVATLLALIGFKLFPLMPPRLLPGSYGFVDTLAKYPTFWSFNSGAVSKISNQYAAMPSVHVCWSTWCALVFAPRVKHRWAKVLAVAYPFFTVIVIVITGNHYLLDAVGGLVVLSLGWVTRRHLHQSRPGRTRRGHHLIGSRATNTPSTTSRSRRPTPPRRSGSSPARWAAPSSSVALPSASVRCRSSWAMPTATA